MIAAPRSDNAMSDMAAIMARVRKMSDSQLADILAGKDVSVPQFAAMTEAMGRRQLRDAVKGAEAQQQAQQPSVKDQLMMADTQEAGLAALPAPNMESMDMASGGIVAFEGGGEVPRFQSAGIVLNPDLYTFSNPGTYTYQEDPERRRIREINEEEERIRKERKEAVANIFSGKNTAAGVRSGTKASAAAAANLIETQDSPLDFDTPTEIAARREKTKKDAAAKAVNALKENPPTPDISQPTTFERRASPFGQINPEAVDFNRIKEQGMGEGLMRLGAGILSKPTLAAGLGTGINALAESGALTRKEIAGLKKDARDYDFNIKKADAAFELGQDELAQKYFKMAQDKELGLAQVAKMGQSGDLNLIKALQKPGEDLSDTFARVYSMKKPTDVLSRKDALAEYSKNPAYKREFGDFETYYQVMSNRLISGTLQPGANVIGKV
jgi:hypothetical protein